MLIKVSKVSLFLALSAGSLVARIVTAASDNNSDVVVEALPETFSGATIELLKEFESEIAFQQVLFRDSIHRKTHPYVLFSTYDNNNVYSLWSTDGTEDGTQLIKETSAGSSMNMATEYHGPEYKGKYYFVWKDDSDNDQLNLYTTEGTQESTKVLTQLDTTNSNSKMPTEYVLFKNKLYWILGSELWMTDGTAENTKLVEDFQSITSGKIHDLAVINNQYLLLADRSYGILLRSDGKVDGSSTVLTNNAPNLNLRPNDRNPTLKNGVVVFPASNGLWSTDGTRANTKLIVEDLKIQEICSDEIHDGTKKAVFIDGSRNILFITDGTTEGTYPINVTDTSTFEDANMEYVRVSSSSLMDTDIAISRAGDISFDDGEVEFANAAGGGYDYGMVSKFSGSLICGPMFGNQNGRGIYELNSDGMSIWATTTNDGDNDKSNNIDLFHSFDSIWPMDGVMLPNGRFLMYTWHGANQIWLSDGSSVGTKLLVDFPGPQAAGGQGFAVLSNNVVLVRGASSTQEKYLYRLNIPEGISPNSLASSTVNSVGMTSMMIHSLLLSMGFLSLLFASW